MGRYMDAVVRFLDSIGFKYDKHPEKSLIFLGFSGRSGDWSCVADIKEDRGIFIFYSILSAKVPERTRLPVAEFLTRANYNLILGNFELDMSDGEVRFKTSVNVDTDPLTATIIKPMVLTNLAMVDKYLPGIMAVAFGGKSPEVAVKEIEGQ